MTTNSENTTLDMDEIAYKVQNIFAQTLSIDDELDIIGTGTASYKIADMLSDIVKDQRNKALDVAAASVEAVAHEGLHASMWRNKFERAAETIRLMKVEP